MDGTNYRPYFPLTRREQRDPKRAVSVVSCVKAKRPTFTSTMVVETRFGPVYLRPR